MSFCGFIISHIFAHNKILSKPYQSLSKKFRSSTLLLKRFHLDELIDHLDIHGEKKRKLWYTVFSKRISNLLVVDQGFKYELLLGFRHLLHNRDYFSHN